MTLKIWILALVLVTCAVNASFPGFLKLKGLFSGKTKASFQNEKAKSIYFVTQLPYGTEEKIRNGTCGVVCTKIDGVKLLEFVKKVSDDGDENVFTVALNDSLKEVYISFKGTSSDMQLIHELFHSSYQPYETEFFKTPNAKAMQYFQTIYKDFLRQPFLENIKKYANIYPSHKFYITGYSLGGALASLAALDAVTSGYLPVREDSPALFTYGSPRVANSVLSDAINSKIPVMFRIVSYNDMVAHIPPCNLYLASCKKEERKEGEEYSSFLAGWHLKREIWYGTEGDFENYKECSTETTEDVNCSDSMVYLSVETHKSYYGYKSYEIIE